MSRDRRDYDRSRALQRKADLAGILGGKCERCGSEDNLHFDHIDPETKSFAICSGLLKPWQVLLAELAKCQLLCDTCYVKKAGNIVSHGGGVSGKKNCPCEPCRERKKEYMREWKRRGRVV